MKPFPILISAEQIQTRVREMGAEITARFKAESSEPLLVIGVLKGSFILLADLVRHIDLDCRVDFLEASSYGSGTVSSGEVKLKRDIGLPIEGKNVILVEDIVDTGHTITFLREHLSRQKPKSLSVCSLLFKPSRKEKDVKIDYLGFTIEDHFVIGYGLDFDGRYRHLKDVVIYQVG